MISRRSQPILNQRTTVGLRIALEQNKMLRIQRSDDQGGATLVLSGRIEERHVAELRSVLEAEPKGTSITLDLEEIRLVDREGVRFLAACEARGITLKNCRSYIREWIETGGEADHGTVS